MKGRRQANIREAIILGYVGAGGLGQQIQIAISLFLENKLLTLILAIYLMVTLDGLPLRLPAPAAAVTSKISRPRHPKGVYLPQAGCAVRAPQGSPGRANLGTGKSGRG